MNKIKGFILIELLISIAILSILSLGIYGSAISFQKTYKAQTIKEDMLNLAINICEKEKAGIQNHDNNDFQVLINRSTYSERIDRITVEIFSEEINEKTEITTYVRKEN